MILDQHLYLLALEIEEKEGEIDKGKERGREVACPLSLSPNILRATP